MAHKVNPYRVLKNLTTLYERKWRRHEFIPSAREIELQEALKDVIDDFLEGRTTIEFEEECIQVDNFEDLGAAQDSDYITEILSDSQDAVSSESPSGSSLYQSSSSAEFASPKLPLSIPTWEKVTEAVHFWRSTKPHPFGKKQNVHLKFSTVQKKFSFVKTEAMLYYWEKFIQKDDKPHDYKLIAIEKSVRSKFQLARDKQEAVHERDLFRWGIQAASDEHLSTFKCSRYWIQCFKKKNRISNRRVTKFISRKMAENLTDLVAKAEEFVLEVQELILEYGPENTFNMDQSGFEKCLMSTQTLASTGSKGVNVVASSVAGTTHTYTIQPVISASGKFLLPVTICLQENDGKFGPNVQRDMFRSSLIHPIASKSGKMGTAQLREWFLEVFLPATGPKVLLLVDSYTAHQSLLDLIPETRDIKIKCIPPGTTGLIQPLDVHGFKFWKDLVRYFSTEASRCVPEVAMYPRNSILKMQAIISYFLSSTKLHDFWKYSWSKCGYILEEVTTHPSPMKVCTSELTKNCNLCASTSFVVCPLCDESLCFEHCFSQIHINCSTAA